MRSIVIAATLLSAGSSIAQTPSQFAANAAVFSEKADAPMIVVHQTPTKDAWVKVQTRFSNPKWDVKQTDSLLSPVIAYVVLDLETRVSSNQESKEAAESASVNKKPVEERVELEFIPTKTGWGISKARSLFKSVNQWFPTKAYPAVFTPHGWVINGFSVEK